METIGNFIIVQENRYRATELESRKSEFSERHQIEER